MCEAGWYKTFVRINYITLQCDAICRAYCLCSSIPMIIWCDHCLLVALCFRFHIELAKCLLFRSRSPDLIPKYERQKPLITRRERSGAPHASLVYHLVVAWVVWKNFCVFVWHFVMTVMSSFCCYLFAGIPLMAWPKPWPVGMYHCSNMCYWFHGNVSRYEAGLRHYLDTNMRAE